MELPILSRRRAGGDDAELAPREVELRAGKDLAVSFDDHPGVERGVQRANVLAEPFVEWPVHDRARGLTLLLPLAGAIQAFAVVAVRRGPTGHFAPLSGGVQRAWTPGAQVRLQDDLLDPFHADVVLGACQLRANVCFAARGNDRGQPDEGAFLVAQRRDGNPGR